MSQRNRSATHRRIILIFLALSLSAAGCALFAEPEAPPDLGSIFGTLWLDSNANGLREEGESGVPEVRVQLLNQKDDLLVEMGTNSRGEYNFQWLDVYDEWAIRVLLPEGYAFSAMDAGAEDVDSDVQAQGERAGYTELLTEIGKAGFQVDAGLVLGE